MMSPRWGLWDCTPSEAEGCTPSEAEGVNFLSHLSFQPYDITHSSNRNKHNSSRTDSRSCSDTHEALSADCEV